MTLTTLQFRLEKACNETLGRFRYHEDDKIAVCSFLNGTHSIEVDDKDNVELNAPLSWARFEAVDIGSIFEKSIPKSGQGIWIKSPKNYAEIGLSGWHITEKSEVIS